MINNSACLFGDTSNKGDKNIPFFINNYAKQTKQMEEQWLIDLRNFECDEPDPSEFIQVPQSPPSRKGCKHDEETKRKISIKNKGNKSKTGQKLSDETKQKISKANIGKKGIPITPEMRKKMNEGRRKAQSAIGENNPRARHYEITFEDGRVECIKSLQTWASANGYVPMSIRNLYNGNGNTKHKDIIKVRPL